LPHGLLPGAILCRKAHGAGFQEQNQDPVAAILLRHLGGAHHPRGADAGIGHHHFPERPGVHHRVEWAAGRIAARDLMRRDGRAPGIKALAFRKIIGVEVQDRYRSGHR